MGFNAQTDPKPLRQSFATELVMRHPFYFMRHTSRAIKYTRTILTTAASVVGIGHAHALCIPPYTPPVSVQSAGLTTTQQRLQIEAAVRKFNDYNTRFVTFRTCLKSLVNDVKRAADGDAKAAELNAEKQYHLAYTDLIAVREPIKDAVNAFNARFPSAITPRPEEVLADLFENMSVNELKEFRHSHIDAWLILRSDKDNDFDNGHDRASDRRPACAIVSPQLFDDLESFEISRVNDLDRWAELEACFQSNKICGLSSVLKTRTTEEQVLVKGAKTASMPDVGRADVLFRSIEQTKGDTDSPFRLCVEMVQDGGTVAAWRVNAFMITDITKTDEDDVYRHYTNISNMYKFLDEQSRVDGAPENLQGDLRSPREIAVYEWKIIEQFIGNFSANNDY
jgi:hypothetical protein